MLVINMNKKALYVYIAGFNQLWNIDKCIRKECFFEKTVHSLEEKAHLLHSYILFQVIIVYFPQSHQFFPSPRLTPTPSHLPFWSTFSTFVPTL